MKGDIVLPEKVLERLESIKEQFNEIYYQDKLDICHILYDKSISSEQLWKKMNRYAGYRIYQYEPILLDETVLGDDRMYQIKLMHELAIETT